MKKKLAGLMVMLVAALCVIGMVNPLKAEAATIKLNKTEVNLEVGDKVKVKVKKTKKKVKWKSDNKAVATVTQRGNITGVAAGECNITAKVGKTVLTCKVTVKDSVLEVLDESVTVNGVELLKNSKWTPESENKSKNVYQYSMTDETFRWIWVEIVSLTDVECEELSSSEESFTAACNILVKDSFEGKYEVKEDTFELLNTTKGFVGKSKLTCLSYGNEVATIIFMRVEGNKLVVVMSMEIEPDAFTEKLVHRICIEAKTKAGKK